MGTKKKDNENESLEIESAPPFVVLDAPKEKSSIRMIGLFGEIDVERSAEICYSMLSLKEDAKDFIYEKPAEDDSSIKETIIKPIEFWISTCGGSATSMFAVYDTIRMVREVCEIHTYGIGRVMSAGVLLLAAGTKGKRKIGANCRIMLHSVMGGQQGSLHNLENEMEEVRWTQQQYIKAIIDETDITEKHFKRLLNRKINVYLDATEAVELGIADEIV